MDTALQESSQDATRCHARPSSAGLEYFRKHLLCNNSVTSPHGQRDSSLVPHGACGEVPFPSTGAEGERQSVPQGSVAVKMGTGRQGNVDSGRSNITRKKPRKLFPPQRPEPDRSLCASSAMENKLDPALGDSVHVQVKSRAHGNWTSTA